MRAVFAGVARDCANHLPVVLANLAWLAECYREASFVFVVSDSSDDTHAILQRWLSRGHRGKAIDLGHRDNGTALAHREARFPRRPERIPPPPNESLDETRRSGWGSNAHLVVVALDDVLDSPLQIAAFAGAFADGVRWLADDPARA